MHLPPLPGINSAAAVARLAGSSRLYVKTLCMFLKSIPHHEEELAAALEQKDTQRLCRAAHTIKGLTATVGAMEASALAADMETRLIATEALPEADQVDTLMIALEALAETIAVSGLCADGTLAGGAVPAPSPGPVDEVTFKDALSELAALLESDDAGAPECFSAHAGVFAAGLPPDARNALEKSLRRFDYDAALHVIRNLPK